MEVKPGFKYTEAGVVPEDWNVSLLGALAKTSSGTTPARALHDRYYKNGSIPWVKTMDLTNGEILGTSEYVTDIAFRETSLSLYPTGTVLVAMYGGFQQIGRTGLLRSPAAINQAITAIRPNTGELVPEYLLATLNHRISYWRTVASSSRKDPNITGSDVRSFAIAYPEPSEQRTIAAAVSDVDALLSELDRLITKTRNLKQAAMQQLLTGQTRLPGFQGEWEVKRLGSILRFQVGFPFSSAFFNDKEQGIRLIKNRDLKSDDQIFHYSGKYESTYLVSDGDVLIGMDGDFLPCRWAKGTALLNQRVGRIVPLAGLNRDFAYYFLIAPLKEIEAATSSTTVKHLSHGDVESIEKPIPEIGEQTAIAVVLSDIDAEISALEARHDKTRALKQAMMQELLTGKTRLVPIGDTSCLNNLAPNAARKTA